MKKLTALLRKHGLFFVFAFTIFLKVVVFRMATAHVDKWQELLTYPTFFFISWFGKVLPAVIIASFVYLCHRHQWWTIVFSLVIDVWIVANLFYFKANGLYLTYEAMTMAGNLHGFENSLLALLGWDVYIIPLITLGYVFLYFFLRLGHRQKQSIKCGLAWIFSFLLLDCVSNYTYWYNPFVFPDTSFKEKITKAWPFGLVYQDAHVCLFGVDGFAKEYMYYQSVLSYFPASILYHIWGPHDYGKLIELKDDEFNFVDTVFGKPMSEIHPQHNLVFILVESLESWPMSSEVNSSMPHLSELAKSSHVFYADRVRSQIRHGISGDGQLICMTGLLPVERGAACFLYGENAYPNFASSFVSSAILDPCMDAWNQKKMTRCYGFQNLFEPDDYVMCDAEIMAKTADYVTSGLTEPFCVLGITISSHFPFVADKAHSRLYDAEMPQLMSNYLNCLTYADSCVSLVVESVLKSSLADNTIIVITGDHTAFRSEGFSDLDSYASAKGIPFKANHNYVPLIIYSPDIERNEYLHDEVYQMDIFPTVCAMLDSTVHNPSFGVNLRDSVARQHRPISEEEAYRMSDLIIRSNYFGLQK
ncbi:MAG: hypothetical protein E7070_00410 [Bacteroidales bacterium]|jgi:phosphoglycerol transferase MdoB-like AlkP superfamily enzyme|nr:hypothetical protein [Bacteroidales bacterium]